LHPHWIGEFRQRMARRQQLLQTLHSCPSYKQSKPVHLSAHPACCASQPDTTGTRLCSPCRTPRCTCQRDRASNRRHKCLPDRRTHQGHNCRMQSGLQFRNICRTGRRGNAQCLHLVHKCLVSKRGTIAGLVPPLSASMCLWGMALAALARRSNNPANTFHHTKLCGETARSSSYQVRRGAHTPQNHLSRRRWSPSTDPPRTPNS